MDLNFASHYPALNVVGHQYAVYNQGVFCCKSDAASSLYVLEIAQLRVRSGSFSTYTLPFLYCVWVCTSVQSEVLVGGLICFLLCFFPVLPLCCSIDTFLC